MDIKTALYWFDKTNILVRQIKFKHEKQEVLDQTQYLPHNASMPQRLWHIIHQTEKIPGCKICQSPVSWNRRLTQYKTYCGDPKCPNIDPDVIERKRAKLDYKEITKKRQQTCKEKYGHTNYLASEAGKIVVKDSFDTQTPKQKKQRYNKATQSRQKTIKEKYGVNNIGFLYYADADVLQQLNVVDWLTDQHHKQKKSLTTIATELGVASGSTTVGKYLRKCGIEVLNPSPISSGEREIGMFLDQHNIQYNTNDRSIIHPFELDIYIPQHNLAIEYCGLYWHSEQKGKDKWYHHNKWKRCMEQGVQLLTVYEDEWQQVQQQVKQKILHLLGIDNRKRIFARKCKIGTVTSTNKKLFLNSNHIQGNGPSGINLGLWSDDELVAVMCIQERPEHHYLTRYATSQHVVGGFSKLLKYFQQHYTWSKLVSFADLRWSSGNLYESTGWVLDQTIVPDYYYSPNGRDRFHKFNYRRKNLPKLLDRFDPSMSERQNCDINGILRIWDCGKRRFVIENKTQLQ